MHELPRCSYGHCACWQNQSMQTLLCGIAMPAIQDMGMDSSANEAVRNSLQYALMGYLPGEA